MKSEDKKLNVPRTGRIGRFIRLVESKTSEDTFWKVVEYSEEYGKYKPEKKAERSKNSVEKLEDEAGTGKAIDIMKTCGSKCCGKGNRETAKRLWRESSSIDEFLKKLSTYEVKDGELEYKRKNENTIIAKHNRCFCGQVKKTRKHFKNSTYCQCSVAFNKQFFEAAFNQVVEVELKQSIITGGDYCEFEIKLQSRNI